MDTVLKMVENYGPGILIIIAGIFWAQKVTEYFFNSTLELKKHELDQEFDKYKLQLKHEEDSFKYSLDEKLEEHKHKFELIKQEFQIQYSTLYQERNNVIKILYANLVELHSALTIFTSIVQPVYEDAEKEDKERVARVGKALTEFTNHFLINRIFIPHDICEKIDFILKEYHDKSWDYGFYQSRLKEGHLDKEVYLEYSKICQDISKTIKTEYPPLITEIETLFRKLLGDK